MISIWLWAFGWLLAQVVNYLKSEPGRRVLVDFPGEFRLLGALWKPAVDVTPLDTAIRGAEQSRVNIRNV